MDRLIINSKLSLFRAIYSPKDKALQGYFTSIGEHGITSGGICNYFFLQYHRSEYKVSANRFLLCLKSGRLAQLVEQLTLNQQVEGSSPSSLIQKRGFFESANDYRANRMFLDMTYIAKH